MSRRAPTTGARGEAFAAAQLQARGCTILEQNYHSRYGEIDIIAQEGAYLLFVEVKTRRAYGLTGPLEAVTLPKQQRILKTAMCYLQVHFFDLQPRFDVVAVTVAPNGTMTFEWVKNAFSV